MNDEEKDFTEYYNELKKREREMRDKERNKKLKAQKICIIIRNSIIVILIMLIIIPFFKEAKEYKNVFFTFNVVEQLDYMYNGKFVIISPIFDESDMVTPNGLYIVKDEKNNITFNAYKHGNSLITDYDQYLYKKYALEYIEKNNIDYIYYKDTKQENTTDELFWFKFGMKINSFNDIENAVNKIIEMCRYINKKVTPHLDFEAINYKPVIVLNDFEGYMSQDITYYTSNYYTKKIKTEYVIYTKQNNINDEEITDEIIVTYYKPNDMKLIVDGTKCEKAIGGRTIDVNPSYDYFINDYCVNFDNLIDKLKCIEEYNIESSGKLKSIKFNGNIYEFDITNEITNKKIPYRWSMSMLKDFFGAEITYDYNSKVINIVTTDN